MRTEFKQYYEDHPHSLSARTRGIRHHAYIFEARLFGIRLKTLQAGSEKWHVLQQKLSNKSSSDRDCLMRATFYQKSLKSCGNLLYVLPGTTMCFPKRITIGENVFINRNVYIVARTDIEIGTNVLIGPNVVINSGSHNYEDMNKIIRDQGHKVAPIRIEDDVWVAANVSILPGVTIGKGAVVGAGAVVTRDIEPFAVAVGVPAKTIGYRH